jgi:hypothetical protein
MNARRMSLVTLRFGWLIVGLIALPPLSTTAGPQQSVPQARRLERLLTMHDVRHAIHAPRDESACLHDMAEDER